MVFIYFHEVGAGISTPMSISDRFMPVNFQSKDGKDEAYGGKIDRKVIISNRNWHFFVDFQS